PRLPHAQPALDDVARRLRRADLLSVPVDLIRRRNPGMSQVSIRPAVAPDHAAVLALADRLPAFGPTTRPASEIADRERAVLATALSQPVGGSAILVAEQPSRGVVGVILLESRRDYFTNGAHGHVAILARVRGAEGQGTGRGLFAWGQRGQAARVPAHGPSSRSHRCGRPRPPRPYRPARQALGLPDIRAARAPLFSRADPLPRPCPGVRAAPSHAAPARALAAQLRVHRAVRRLLRDVVGTVPDVSRAR